MHRTILLVSAHPEPTSLTHTFVKHAKLALQQAGHTVLASNLYEMRWKAVLDADDFPDRLNTSRLSVIEASGHAYTEGLQTPDVVEEQNKLTAADAVIFCFPFWWYGVPAILKGWFERVYAYGFAYGYRGEGNRFRFGEGALQGKRAMLATMIGGGREDYGARGINGALEELLFPVTHGCLYFPGMDVLSTHAVYGAARISTERVEQELRRWEERLKGLFIEPPLPFRPQNGGDYPDGHQLGAHITPDQVGLRAHVQSDYDFLA